MAEGMDEEVLDVMNYDNALSYSSQWLDIIKQETFPEEAQAKWIIDESKQNFAEHFNRGWLEYRKSVTEAEREERHRRGDTDVDTDISSLGFVAKLACG